MPSRGRQHNRFRLSWHLTRDALIWASYRTHGFGPELTGRDGPWSNSVSCPRKTRLFPASPAAIDEIAIGRRRIETGCDLYAPCPACGLPSKGLIVDKGRGWLGWLMLGYCLQSS